MNFYLRTNSWLHVKSRKLTHASHRLRSVRSTKFVRTESQSVDAVKKFTEPVKSTKELLLLTFVVKLIVDLLQLLLLLLTKEQ